VRDCYLVKGNTGQEIAIGKKALINLFAGFLVMIPGLWFVTSFHFAKNLGVFLFLGVLSSFLMGVGVTSVFAGLRYLICADINPNDKLPWQIIIVAGLVILLSAFVPLMLISGSLPDRLGGFLIPIIVSAGYFIVGLKKLRQSKAT